MVPDFSGYVTRYGLKCTDGRTILAHAFEGNDGTEVPLVWQHLHSSTENVLGHLKLTHRDDGVYAEGFFNDTKSGREAKSLVIHKDIKALSIYANQLVQRGLEVLRGVIKEGSLVMAGANPGAFIDYINVAHGDDPQYEDEAIISSMDPIIVHSGDQALARQTPQAKPALADLAHQADLSAAVPAGPPSQATAADILASFTDEQRDFVWALVGYVTENATGGSASQADEGGSSLTGDAHQNDPSSTDQNGATVTRNVFQQDGAGQARPAAGATLTHADAQGIFAMAVKLGSLKAAVEDYALAHGIDDISTLFPYDQPVTTTPDWVGRRTEWVAGVLNGVKKSPFSRIRSWMADITQDDARARGYVTGAMKKEEFYGVTRRVTTPTTFYKKQKLDRDDMLDITEFDVVQWMQGEMRIMLDEELARAILLGDGRDIADADKINEDCIRPILGDHELFQETLYIDLTDSNSSSAEIIDGVTAGMRYYRGTGQPVFYTTQAYITSMLMLKDTLGRRLYGTKAELANVMGVRDLIPCEVMEAYPGVIGVIVNLVDYTVGTDRGGQVTMFDDFDIDYNKYTYLMEGRCSGALTKYKSALVVMEFTGAGGMLADPTKPGFVRSTGVVTVPTMADVTYHTVDADGVESAALTAGAQTAIQAGVTVHYRAKPAATHSFSSTAVANWNFQRPHA